MSINSVTIAGNMTRDPELRETSGGMPVLIFGVAVNERVKDGEQWVNRPNYIDCTMFGKRAASVAQYLGKGAKVAVQGRLRWSQWEKNGEKRSKLEVIADEIDFMSRRDGEHHEQPAPKQAVTPTFYDDIPF